MAKLVSGPLVPIVCMSRKLGAFTERRELMGVERAVAFVSEVHLFSDSFQDILFVFGFLCWKCDVPGSRFFVF